MSRLTKRWGTDESDISGRAVCEFSTCGYSIDCRTCHHALINNRLAEYEDKIPYERLDEAAELLAMFTPVEIDQEIIDKFCSIGCTSFRLTKEEIEELLNKQEG